MSTVQPNPPGYDLEDLRIVSTPAELKGMFHPLRATLLDLVLERAATVQELAQAVKRPKSTVAYHVKVLMDADLLKVVDSRRVRAIEERFYGRTARTFYVGTITPDQLDTIPNSLETAAAESAPAHRADTLRCVLRHARISPDSAREFWTRVFALLDEYSEIPREGEQTFAFAAGLYPVDQHPMLPPRDQEPS